MAPPGACAVASSLAIVASSAFAAGRTVLEKCAARSTFDACATACTLWLYHRTKVAVLCLQLALLLGMGSGPPRQPQGPNQSRRQSLRTEQ